MKLKQFFRDIFHPAKNHKSVESQAIYFSIGSGIVSFLAALAYFGGRENLPIFGRISIGTTAIILSAVVGFVAYTYVTYQQRRKEHFATFWRRIYMVISLLSLSFIHAAIVFLLATVMFYVVSEAFIGVRIDIYASSIIVSIIAATAGYVMYLVASHRSALMVSSALAIFLVSGVLTSMITASDPYWWEKHLSSLGAAGSSGLSTYAFNLTLIIGGAVVVCIADMIAEDFARLGEYNKKYRTAKAAAIRTILLLIGLFLAGVGLFPYDTMPMLHNTSASGMVVLFLVLIIGLRPFAPMLSRAFFLFTYALMAALVLSIILYTRVGYFDLTSFEIICFALVFGWLVVFIRQVAATLHDEATKHLTA